MTSPYFIGTSIKRIIIQFNEHKKEIQIKQIKQEKVLSVLTNSDPEIVEACKKFAPKSSYDQESSMKYYSGSNFTSPVYGEITYEEMINKCVEYFRLKPSIENVRYKFVKNDQGQYQDKIDLDVLLQEPASANYNGNLYVVLEIFESGFSYGTGTKFLVKDIFTNGLIDPSNKMRRQFEYFSGGGFVFDFSNKNRGLTQFRGIDVLPPGKYRIYLDMWGLRSNELEFTVTCSINKNYVGCPPF